MKTLNLIKMVIIAILVCVGLSACSSSSDDDNADNGNTYSSLIVGKWKLISSGKGSPVHTHVEFKKMVHLVIQV